MVGGISERGFYGLGLKTDTPLQHQKQQKQEPLTFINHAQDEKGGKNGGEDINIKLGAAAFAALPASHTEEDFVPKLFPDPEEVDPWN